MSNSRDQSDSGTRRSDHRSKVPGYGWKPNLSGLEHPRQFMGFFLTVVAVIVVSMVIAAIAFG